MAQDLYLAVPSWTGTWHRFRVIDHARAFVAHAGCRLHVIWAVSHGVANCRFEDLFSPIPNIRVLNLSESGMDELEQRSSGASTLEFDGKKLAVYRPGGKTTGNMIAFDFEAARALEAAVPKPNVKKVRPLRAIPAAELRNKANNYINDMKMSGRLGVRVRVTECSIDGRKPRRIQPELDETLRSIICLPWHTPVFLVTDSEYMQLMLSSHFHDCRFLRKSFTEEHDTGQYLSRFDREGMRVFMTEVMCLEACRKIINIGGFLNQDSVADKIVRPPWDIKALDLRGNPPP